jgi:hypothetical protein
MRKAEIPCQPPASKSVRVEHVAVAPALGAGGELRHVRSGPGLRDGEAEHLLAAPEPGQPALLLLRGDVREELGVIRASEAREHAVEVAARHLLRRDADGDQIPLVLPALPELLAEGDHPPDLLGREARLRVVALVIGQQLGERDLAQARAVLLLGGREAEVEHGPPRSTATRTRSRRGMSARLLGGT